ncbi:MAG: winged helix-turn-helix domain-containing protein [Nitrososphaeraceae archaeon]
MEVVEARKHRHLEQRRGNYEIVNDILQFIVSKYNCNVAEITTGASLSYFQQLRYVNLLIDRGLILISSESDYCKGYEISDLGRRYLRVLTEMQNDLRPVITS